MIRSTLLAGFVCGIAGCAQQPQADATPKPPAVVARVSVPAAPTQPDLLPQIADAPRQLVAFEYPADLGGQMVERAISPRMPSMPPVEMFGTAPKLRTGSDRLLHPEVSAKARYVPPPILLPKAAEMKLAPPAERVPAELGRGADHVPARPQLPVAPGITERARDVNLPPTMPTLGRPASDRVSLADPTSEFGNAAIVAPPVQVPIALASFLRVTLPDPFELGVQVRPKLPPDVEPALTPVPVNPQRVK